MGANSAQVRLGLPDPQQGLCSTALSHTCCCSCRLKLFNLPVIHHQHKCSPNIDESMQSKEVTRLNSIYGNILKNNNVEQLEGKAYIKDEHTVQVLHPESGEVLKELTTKNILIAVGGGPARLNVPGGEHTMTSDEALSLPEQPKTIAIIGAGYIAVEFAGIFAGFGSAVHLFYRKDLPLTSTIPSLLPGLVLGIPWYHSFSHFMYA